MTDGKPLFSAPHPAAPWWKFSWLWLRFRRIKPSSLETIEIEIPDATSESGRIFEDDEGNKFWWPSCTVTGCRNHICRWYSDEFCYVHMPQEVRDRKDADGNIRFKDDP